MSQESGRKLLNALLEGKDAEAMKLLKEKVDFSVDCKGDNPIHLAARNGKVDIIKQMKLAGVDLRQRNMHGNSAVHYAAKGGHIDTLKYLKQHDVDLNTPNGDGESPLDKAVTCQTMNVIEALVDLGMNPNAQNRKTGDTPLFTAVRAGAQEAMEGLLIKGAKPGITNKQKQKAEDVAANSAIKESLRMYTTLLIAMSAKNIKAKGMKISRKDYKQSMVIDRVGVVLEKFDIPKEFPTGFYCRREKTENATIQLKKIDEESVFSDIFHIRIFDVNRNCPVQINLPLYKAPTDKEQMVLRFYNCQLDDRQVDECIMQNGIPYCPFIETLVPEANYGCVVYIRQKKEENKITDEETKITSKLEKDFALDIPAGSFKGEIVLSLQVFDANESNYSGADVSEGLDDDMPDKSSKMKQEQSSNNTKQINLKQKGQMRDAPVNSPEKASKNTGLLTDVYQINVSEGQQPQKRIMMQIPLTDAMSPDDEIAIVSADEQKLSEERTEGVLEVLPGKPQIVDCNLIFEVSHFSMYVATLKKKVEREESKLELQRQLSSLRDKRKTAAFFVILKKDPDDRSGLRHIVLVECGMSLKSQERRLRWLERDFKEQTPAQTEDIMMAPGDTFYTSVTGNASMEDESDSQDRKIQFSQCRASFQAFKINLSEGIFSEKDAKASIVISKQTEGDGLEKLVELPMQLIPPPRPPTPPAEGSPMLKVQNFMYGQGTYNKPTKTIKDSLRSFFPFK